MVDGAGAYPCNLLLLIALSWGHDLERALSRVGNSNKKPLQSRGLLKNAWLILIQTFLE